MRIDKHKIPCGSALERRVICLVLLLFFCLGGGLTWGAAASRWTKRSECVSLYRLKSYLHAAQCFAELARALGPAQKLSQAKREEKGQLLRNAAVALKKLAGLSKKPEVASYHREEAVRLLQQYQKEKLCETPYRCQTALALETSLRRKIGYASLTLVTGQPQATLVLRGYRFMRQGQGNWSLTVRPGPYSVTVTYPGQKPVRRRFVVRSAQPVIQTFQGPAVATTQKTPLRRGAVAPRTRGSAPTTGRRVARALPRRQPPKQAKGSLPVISWVGYVGGGVVFVLGGALAGWGGAQWIGARNIWNDAATPYTKRGELIRERQEALFPLWIGVGALGAGAVLLLVGAIVHLSMPGQTRSAHLLGPGVPSPTLAPPLSAPRAGALQGRLPPLARQAPLVKPLSQEDLR